MKSQIAALQGSCVVAYEKVFEAILMFRGYFDSLVFLLTHALSTKMKPA